jgi:polyhydroxybutyrate depolymerase
MLKHIFGVSLVCTTLLLHPAARATDACTALRPGTNHVTVISGGQKQDVALMLPASFDAAKRVPLVIGLHPSGGTGASFDQDSGLSAAAMAKGFAVILPDGGVQLSGGEGHYWNIPGVPLVGGGEVPKGSRDDVRFISDAIDHLVKNSCVDASRVYVTGFSGGARMSSIVGCRLADRVTAVAPVAGLRVGRAVGPDFTEPDATDCRPARPLTVLAIHGTDDPTNPFPGGEGLRWGYSVERAAARWASLDQCGTTPPALEKVSAHVTRVRYGACRASSEVLLYRIEASREQGGGHVWPGGQRDRSTRLQSSKSPVEIEATAVVLEFFARH